MADPNVLSLPITVFETMCNTYEELSAVFKQQPVVQGIQDLFALFHLEFGKGFYRYPSLLF